MPSSESHRPSASVDSRAIAQADRLAFDAFMGDVHDLAKAVDPLLAGILKNSETPSASAKPWTGSRKRGLELCLKMLRYARVEVSKSDEGRRLDLGIDYVSGEIARLDQSAGERADN